MVKIINISSLIPSLGSVSIDTHVLEKLETSIRLQGMYNPLLVYKSGRKYIIIDGYHRYLACKSLEKKTIRVNIEERVNNDVACAVYQWFSGTVRSVPTNEIAKILRQFDVSVQMISDLLMKSKSWVYKQLKP